MVYQILVIHSFFFLLFFAFLKMVLSSVSKFISDLCLYNFFLFSYSSEEYYRVLSQKTILLLLYVLLFIIGS